MATKLRNCAMRSSARPDIPESLWKTLTWDLIKGA
jgi:hypothetical protein